MPDWKQLVRERVGTLNMPPGAQDEVVAELAAHFEDSAEGMPASAERCALDHIRWFDLARAIEHTKGKEPHMNRRTKVLMLPTTTILFATGMILVLLDRAAILQRLIWLGCMMMLLATAASEAGRLNGRTRSFWLPGFMSLTAATFFLFSIDLSYNPSFFFRQITLHPQDVLRFNAAAPRLFYLVWLLVQVAFAALAAFFSQRAGGSRTSRILAGAFPGVVIIGTYVVMVPVTSFIAGRAYASFSPAYWAGAIVVWVAAPALAVLAGALPFLRQQPMIEATN